MWKLLFYINSIRCTPRNRCLFLLFNTSVPHVNPCVAGTLENAFVSSLGGWSAPFCVKSGRVECPPFVSSLGGWCATFCVKSGRVVCHLLCRVWEGGVPPFVSSLGEWCAIFCVKFGRVVCHLLCQVWEGGVPPFVPRLGGWNAPLLCHLNLAWKLMNSIHPLRTHPLKLDQQINHSHID